MSQLFESQVSDWCTQLNSTDWAPIQPAPTRGAHNVAELALENASTAQRQADWTLQALLQQFEKL